MRMKPIAISVAVPKNGPRHEIPPSSPPSSGPLAMPRPSAASNSTIALASPPEAAPTMTASAVAMKSALPSPQPRRKPAIAPMLDARARQGAEQHHEHEPGQQRPARADARLETQPPTSIDTPVIAK